MGISVRWAAIPVVLAALPMSCDESQGLPDAATTDARVEAPISDRSGPDQATADLSPPDLAPPDGPAPNPSWVVFGGSIEGSAGATAIVLDSAGNSYVGGGYSGGAITIGSKLLPTAGAGAPFVAKLDPAGKVLWAKTLSKGTDECGIRSIALDAAGKIYVAGKFKGNPTLGSVALVNYGDFDGYVAQLDPQGQVLWATSFGGPGEDGPVGIAVDQTGNVFAAGNYVGTAIFGSTALTSNGSNDVFVARLTPGGKHAWAISGGGSDFDVAKGMALDGTGGLRIVGYVFASGTYGSFTVTPKSDTTLIVARLDPSGKFLWVSQADAKVFVPGSIAVDVTGNSHVIGAFAQSQATFGTKTLLPSPTNPNWAVPYVAKLDPSGNHVWAVGGGTDSAEPWAIAVDGKGASYVTGACAPCSFGATTLKSYGLRDIFVAKLDAQGAWSKVVSAGGSLVDDGRGIAVDGAGNAFVAGGAMDDPYTIGGSVNTDKLTFSGQQYTVTGKRHVFAWKVPASAP